MNNPYDTLGVDKNATEEQIKKAYRNKCKEHHPDKGGDQERIKEVNAAYAILSDQQKKQNFDKYGDPEGNKNPFAGGGGFGGFEDILNMFKGFGGGFGNPAQNIKKGDNIQVNLKITLSEIITGCNKEIKYNKNVKCKTCSGKGGDNPIKCTKCNGSGQTTQMFNTPFGQQIVQSQCNSCDDGFIIKNHCKDCKGAGIIKTENVINVTVPIGVTGGATLKSQNNGNEIKNGQITGDLLITFEEIPDKDFRRENNNLITEINIPISEAVLGTEKLINSPTGNFKFKIDAGSESGKTFQFNGKGVAILDNYGRLQGAGSLYVKVNVIIPKNLNKEAKLLFEELKKYE